MNPYKSLDQKSFWAPAVAQRDMKDISGLWAAKFKITPSSSFSTYGSCFAQHFSKALVRAGFPWYNGEPAPLGMLKTEAQSFGYGVFSSRTGNVYTTSLLLQWVQWALGVESPPKECWEKDGRFYDPFRPAIEPDGFASEAEMLASRDMCLEAFRKTLLEPQIFVFTLGLTESWVHAEAGYEYPMCPGTVAGEFDADLHKFENQRFGTVRRNLQSAIELIRKANPKMKFLLTVSPVPLTATMSGNHVLVATIQSKSILRAVAGHMADHFKYIDYFPSYEIISSFPYRGAFFADNLRSIEQQGVDHVMANFFAGLAPEMMKTIQRKKKRKQTRKRKNATDLVCEEQILEAFGQ